MLAMRLIHKYAAPSNFFYLNTMRYDDNYFGIPINILYIPVNKLELIILYLYHRDNLVPLKNKHPLTLPKTTQSSLYFICQFF